VESVRLDGSVVTIEGNTDERGGRTGGKVTWTAMWKP
jgi:hypothetical protein